MTATLHDLLKSYREGGVFPSYDQLAAIAGQDQSGAADAPSEPSELTKELRMYADDRGYSHNDYADVMRRAADALDSQPTEPDRLPPLPEPIEVGGEGWGFDDFKSEKTFSCEHMWAYARAAIASSHPTDGGVRNG